MCGWSPARASRRWRLAHSHWKPRSAPRSRLKPEGDWIARISDQSFESRTAHLCNSGESMHTASQLMIAPGILHSQVARRVWTMGNSECGRPLPMAREQNPNRGSMCLIRVPLCPNPALLDAPDHPSRKARARDELSTVPLRCRRPFSRQSVSLNERPQFLMQQASWVAKLLQQYSSQHLSRPNLHRP